MVTRRLEKLTFHFALGTCQMNEVFSLGVSGKRIELTRHTSETLERHSRMNRALALMTSDQRERVTHFVEDVEFPAAGVGLHAVTYPSADPHGIPELALAFVHVATAAKRRHFRRSAKLASASVHPSALDYFGIGAELLERSDSVAAKIDATQIVTPAQAAEALLYSHPDVMNLRADIASSVLHGHIARALKADSTLTEYISSNGPGTKTPYTFVQTVTNPKTKEPYRPITEDDEGKPIVGKDGAALNWPKDSDGKDIIQHYALSEGVLGSKDGETPGAATPLVSAVLRSVAQDPALNGQLWTKQHGRTSTTSRSVTAPAAQPAPGPASAVSEARGAATSKSDPGFRWSLSTLTSMYGLDLHDDTLAWDPASQQLSFDVKNWAARCLSAYVQYYDETGTAIGDLQMICIITPGNAIAGIPTWSSSTPLTMTIPANATKAEVLIGGLGQGGWNKDVDIAGVALTGIFNFAVPLFLLGVSVGSSGIKIPMKDLVLSIGLPILVQAVETCMSPESTGPQAMISIFGEAVAGLLFGPGMGALCAWLTSTTTAEEAVQAVPFVGWALKIASCLVTAGDLIGTTAEVLKSPATYDIEVARVIDVQVDIAADPTHGSPPIWPLESDHWEVAVQYKGGTTVKQSGKMDSIKPETPLSVLFTGDTAISSAPGAQIQVTASFYSSTNWLCGKWSSGWIAAVAPDGSSKLALTGSIIEFLVPLTDQTLYGHYQKLDFQDGHHVWNRTTAQPAAVFSGSTDCSNEGNVLCRLVNITINDLDYAIGYTYQASGQNLPLDFQTGPQNGQMYAFQSISVLGHPENGMKEPTIGFSLQPFISFDQFGPAPLFSMDSATFQPELDAAGGAAVPADLAAVFAAAAGASGSGHQPTSSGNYTLPADSIVTVALASAHWQIGPPGKALYDLRRETDTINVFSAPNPAFSPRNFYLDTRPAATGSTNNHLRQVTLDGQEGTFDYSLGKSWGTFPSVNLDALGVHPNGYVVAVVYESHKMLILDLAQSAVADSGAPAALAVSGKGIREGLMEGPVALTITADGRILVLEQDAARIQAFDTMGNPVQCFAGPLSFGLDAGFKSDLNENAFSTALMQTYQKAIQPQLAAIFSLPAQIAADLNAGVVDEGLKTLFETNGLALSNAGPFEMLTTSANALWLLTDQGSGLSFDIRADLYVAAAGRQLFVLPATLVSGLNSASASADLVQSFTDAGIKLSAAAQLSVEVVTQDSEWLLIDSGVTPQVSYDIATRAQAYVYKGSELLFVVPAGIIDEIGGDGPPPADLVANFESNNIALSSSSTITAGADGTSWQLVDPVSGLTFEIDTEDDLDVFHAASLQVEVVARDSHWILRDLTNTLTFEVKADPSGALKARQLISTMALKDGANPIRYLDIGAETKGFIYVLSYANTGSALSDYHLDIYEPDGSWLARTPRNPGDPGINGARFVVDQWRNLYTLNYESLLGPDNRTEPSISTWIPSTPSC